MLSPIQFFNFVLTSLKDVEFVLSEVQLSYETLFECLPPPNQDSFFISRSEKEEIIIQPLGLTNQQDQIVFLPKSYLSLKIIYRSIFQLFPICHLSLENGF